MAKLYAALRAGDVPDDIAIAAAEEAAKTLRLEADVVLLKWMLGFNLAMTVTIVGKLFLSHGG
jgi:hypothetical protein